MKQLTEAQAALERGEESRALSTLVDAWGESRSHAIASAAEALSKRLEPYLPPIDGKLEDFQPLWLAIAKQQRAVDLPRLLGSVMHGTQRFGVAVVDALVARGKALAMWPADPRAGTVIVDHLVRGGYESTSRSTYPFWTAMFEMVETHADDRVRERLAKVSFARIFRNFSDKEKRIAWFQSQLDAVLARLGEHAPAKLTKAVTERATKLAKSIAKRGPVAPAELARIREQPVIAKAPPKQPVAPPKLDASSARTQLEAALRAMKTGDDAAALRALLEAWRTTRATRIADLVQRVSERHASTLLVHGSRAEVQRAWLETCAEQRAEDLPRLVSTIANTQFRSTDALARVNALASWPSDPRTLAAAIHVIERPPFHASSSHPFWKALIALVVDHQDPRAADALDALAKRSATLPWFRNQLKTAANQLRDRVPAPLALDAAATKACDAIDALFATEEALLAEIYANPDDDHPRQVYADVLQQRGDPRGELIALQLAGKTERAAELLERHVRAWLHPLTPVLDLEHCVFERGFLAQARLYDDVTDADLTSLVGHPKWSTVTHVDLGDMDAVPEKLLAHPVLARATVSGAAARRHPRRRAGTR